MVTDDLEGGGGGRVLRVLTSNEGKAREFAAALEGVPWRVERVAGAYEEVQADTLDEVAVASARAVLRDGLAMPVFVLEDAGLFVLVRTSNPGSARQGAAGSSATSMATLPISAAACASCAAAQSSRCATTAGRRRLRRSSASFAGPCMGFTLTTQRRVASTASSAPTMAGRFRSRIPTASPCPKPAAARARSKPSSHAPSSLQRCQLPSNSTAWAAGSMASTSRMRSERLMPPSWLPTRPARPVRQQGWAGPAPVAQGAFITHEPA